MTAPSGVSSDIFMPDWDIAGNWEEEEQAYLEIDYRKLGVDPTQPTAAKPGSPEKVAMLAARYAAGLPLWHEQDRYDHGPENGETMEAFD